VRSARKPAPPPPPAKPAPSRPLPPGGGEREPGAPDAAPGSAQGAKGVEDLAWAGVAVAAQAATVGVRLANRAFEAARKSIDRP